MVDFEQENICWVKYEWYGLKHFLMYCQWNKKIQKFHKIHRKTPAPEKKRPWQRCFLVNFMKHLFDRTHPGGCFWVSFYTPWKHRKTRGFLWKSIYYIDFKYIWILYLIIDWVWNEEPLFVWALYLSFFLHCHRQLLLPRQFDPTCFFACSVLCFEKWRLPDTIWTAF